MGLNGDDLGVSLFIYIYIHFSIFVVCLVGFLRSAGVGLRVRGLGFRVRMICRWGGSINQGSVSCHFWVILGVYLGAPPCLETSIQGCIGIQGPRVRAARNNTEGIPF